MFDRLQCVRSNVPSLVRYDLGFLVCGAVAGSECPPRVKAGHVARDRKDGEICPTGKSLKKLSSPSRKNFPLNPSGKSFVRLVPSCPARGALAIVTNVGTGCGGRGNVGAHSVAQTNGAEAYGEVVWSWRPDAGVKLRRSICAATVTTKPGHRGEREVSRKAIAQGRPGCLR
jgi:hypothetical protein